MRRILLGLSALVGACSGFDPTDPGGRGLSVSSGVASVTIEPASAILSVGSSLWLRVIVSDANGHELTNRAIAFKSSDERILSVDGMGLVRALAEGTASIDATSEGITGRTTFSVIIPGDRTAWLWGMVVDESGGCIAGATVTVVRGQALGQSADQEMPCDVWSLSGGFRLDKLMPGVEMTLRASAPGWAAKEVTVVPTPGGQTVFLIGLSRLP